jgi:hypothetical protein
MRKPIGLTAPYREDDDDIQDYKKPWVGLTDEDKQIAFDDTQEASGGFWEFADAIEAKLKEKNT